MALSREGLLAKLKAPGASGGGGVQRSLVPWPFGIVGVYEVQAALRSLDSGSFGFMVEGPRL